jgi:hypothetical protein
MAQDFAVLDAVHQSVPTNLDALDSRMAFASDAQQVSRQGDEKLYVRFYAKSVKNVEKSLEANRAIFEEQVFIQIKLPGDKNNDVNRVAYPEDIVRFPIHYERFRKGQEQVVGTPLDALPFLTEPQVEEYKAMYIRTVEQLAGMPDVQCQQIMGSVAHKQQAQKFLDSFKGAERLREEYEADKTKMEEANAAMKAQLEALQAQVSKMASSPTSGAPSAAQVKK